MSAAEVFQLRPLWDSVRRWDGEMLTHHFLKGSVPSLLPEDMKLMYFFVVVLNEASRMPLL